MARALAAVCCVTLLALSGCSFAGFGSGGDAGAPTLTPAPTPERAGPAAGFGPAEGGEIRASRLAQVHAATLAGANYTLTVDRGFGPVTVRVAGNRTLVTDGDRTVYVTDGLRFVRAADGTGAAAGPAVGRPPTGAAVLDANRTLTVTERVAGPNGTRYVLTSDTRYRNGTGPAPYLRAVADERGRVLNFTESRYQRGFGVEVVAAFEVRAVGETTVTPPSWVRPLRAGSNGTG